MDTVGGVGKASPSGTSRWCSGGWNSLRPYEELSHAFRELYGAGDAAPGPKEEPVQVVPSAPVPRVQCGCVPLLRASVGAS